MRAPFAVVFAVVSMGCGGSDGDGALFGASTAPGRGGQQGVGAASASAGGSRVIETGGTSNNGGESADASPGVGGLAGAGGTFGAGGGSVGDGGAVGSGGSVDAGGAMGSLGSGGAVNTGGVAGAGGAACNPQTCPACANFTITCCKLDSTCGCAFRPFAPCN